MSQYDSTGRPHPLFNGDIGICLRDSDGTVMAWFSGDAPVGGECGGDHRCAGAACESVVRVGVEVGSKIAMITELERQPTRRGESL
jgi:hypothetical protein